MQHKKCIYCERSRDVTRESDIEHFRPKAEVTNCDGAGYWWLAYVWTNLLFSCRYCNQEHKRNQFPLIDEATRARRPSDRLARERPFLVDPSQEDPSQFIGFDWAGGDGMFVRPFCRDGSRRGSATIKILGLDRLDLNTERAEILPTLHGIATMMGAGQHFGNPTVVAQASERIREVTSASHRFAGFAREYFRASNLGQYMAND
jgi:uncharacterized protein (TIGR02646 family)